MVNIKAPAVLISALIFLFLTSDTLTWAEEEKPGSTKPKAALTSKNKKKKIIIKRPQKEPRRPQKGDTVPMPPLDDAPFAAEASLLPVLKEAKNRLSREKVSYHPASGGNPAKRELKLALADFKTGNISIVSGHEQTQGLYLNTPGVRYSVHWWNGFNSSIDILDPPNTGIVGLLYALDPKRKSALRRDSVIYTPYSRALLQTELVEAGRRYLSEKISQARMELRHVNSRAKSRVPLQESPVFADSDYFNLILAEHMDPESFRAITGREHMALDTSRERRLTRLVNRILVIIGSNQEDAYKFTGNYASARGLTQFTPIGMRVVWNRYTEADISTDFIEATADHLFAIKAEICLLDHYLAEVLRVHPPLSGTGLEKYAAGACYNGGPKNVFYGLKNFGTGWLYPMRRLSDLGQRESLSPREKRELEWLKKNLNHETFIYLNKMHAIERLQPKMRVNTVQSYSDPAPPVLGPSGAQVQLQGEASVTQQ
jgi:hypothetical protein